MTVPRIGVQALTRGCAPKKRFGERLDALMALYRARLEDHGERRVYRCEFCRGWHLTSQTKGRVSEEEGHGRRD